MAEFTHYAEPFPPHGGAVADLMAAAIAAARLDRTTVLLREVLQNSCDARAKAGKPIGFLVHAFALSVEQAAFVRREFKDVDGLPMKQALGAGEITGLLFADSNTVGLQGPTDAGEAHELTNFSNFFFQVGRSADEGISGGAFGLGRTVLFTFSQCRTAIVYSRFKDGSAVRSRLMAMSISAGFKKGGRKHTGRHWWGKANASPIEGPEADQIAVLLGMDECLVGRSQTGTSVLILQPHDLTEHEEAEESLKPRIHDAKSRRAMINSLLRAAELYAWPHMLDSNAVAFTFKCDGETIPLRDVRQDAVLGKFARAYSAQASADSLVHVSDIDFTGHVGERGRTLGRLSWLTGPSAGPEDESLQEEEVIALHSIALMRQARFVVKYHTVGGIDSSTTRGVFISDADYEPTYRKAEPVTHDDWLPEKLGYPPRQRNEIKQTIAKIDEKFKQSLGRLDPGSQGLGTTPTEIANALGLIFVGEGHHGPRGGENEGRGDRASSRSSRKKSLSLVEENPVRVVSTTAAGSLLEFDFRVSGDSTLGQALPEVSFDVSVFTSDGTRQKSNPGDLLVVSPKILKIRVAGREESLPAFQLRAEDVNEPITVSVSCPSGVATACSGQLIRSNL